MFTTVSAFHLFFWLLVGHALADGPLQGQFLSTAKRVGGIPGLPWWIALGGHALIHGGFVALATQSVELGCAEIVCHFLIDMLKCRGVIGIVTDQVLHVVCKIIWVLVWVNL